MKDFDENLGDSVLRANLYTTLLKKRLDKGESPSAAALGADLDYQLMKGFIPPQQ